MLGVDRDTFIKENMGLVTKVAKRYIKLAENNAALDFEDIKGYGTVGLIEAYNKFDPKFGTKFSTYAVPCIDGRIKRFLRDSYDSIKFPRQLRVNCSEIIKAGLTEEKPIVISKILNMSLEDVEDALGYYRHKYIDELDKTIYEDEGTPVTLAERIGTEIDFDTNIEIEELLNNLDDKAKKVVNLRLNDLTQMEIAKAIGISQVQVSRILNKITKKVQGEIEMGKNFQNVDYKLAQKLARETDLSTAEIIEKTKVSYATAYRYIQDYRTTKEEVEKVKNKQNSKEAPVTTYKLSDKELEKYRLDVPIKTLENNADHNSTKLSINHSTNTTTNPSTITKADREIKVEIIQPAPVKEEAKTPSINADGFLQLDIKASTDDATDKLEEIIKAMKILGFNEFDIKIVSRKVA